VSDTGRRVTGPSLATLFTLAFGLFGWFVGLVQLSDNSFFWHLRTGRLILDRGIPHSDPYSFTAHGARWVAQSWLAEVAYGVIDRWVGSFGLRLLGATIGALIAVLTYRLALRLARQRMLAALLGVAALGGLLTLWSERPLLMGVLAFLGLLWLVEVPDCAWGRRPLLTLPVLMWLWANVHGTWALGLLYVGLHLIGRWLDGAPPWKGRERDLLVASVVSLVVMLVNPYGLSLVTFPLELVARGDILKRVIEWQSPDFHMLRGLVFVVWLGALVCAAARGRNRVTRRDLVVALPFIALALWALRNVALTPLVTLPIAARALAPERDRPESYSIFSWAIAALMGTVLAVLTASATAQPDFVLRSYPVAAMRAVERHGLLGHRLLIGDGDGGYVILRYWPRQLVFMDDRFDMYPLRVTRDYLAMADGTPRWSQTLDRYRVDVVVWLRKAPLAQLVGESAAWSRIHRDHLFVAYVRRSP